MSLINNKSFQITTKFFFVFSLLMIAFSIADALLRNFEIIEITLPYHVVWFCVILIGLLLLAILKKWKSFFLILFLAIGNFLLLMNVIFSGSIRHEKPIKNSNYLLSATSHQYKILKQNCCYKKVIAEKPSGIFFTPDMKTGSVAYFEAKLISESPELLILEIETSGKM
jgi:hypothetical protein